MADVRQYELNNKKFSKVSKSYIPLLDCNFPAWVGFNDLRRGKGVTYGEMLAYADLAKLDRTEFFVKFNIISDIINNVDGVSKK